MERQLGYGDPVIAEAVCAAMYDASYLTHFRYANAYARDAADALAGLWADGRFARVLFTTSGGSANDLVMKLARHVYALEGDARRKLVVGLRGSYHGLTFGAHALSGDDLAQPLYGIDLRLVRHVEPNDVEGLRTLMARSGSQVAAMVVEPVLGTGAVALDDEYVAELLRLRDEHGFLLVADEVATGFGRCGRMFLSDGWPAPPDVLLASKGLTNGVAAAAVVMMSRAVADVFDRADAFPVHGETQAGTPPTCAAILATLEQIDALDALRSARAVADRLDAGLEALRDAHPAAVAELTGRGCVRGVTLRHADGRPMMPTEVPAVVAAAFAEGVVVHPGVAGVQLVPALTYSEAEVDECCSGWGRRFTGSPRPRGERPPMMVSPLGAEPAVHAGPAALTEAIAGLDRPAVALVDRVFSETGVGRAALDHLRSQPRFANVRLVNEPATLTGLVEAAALHPGTRLVVGIGGGTVIDEAKLLAGLHRRADTARFLRVSQRAGWTSLRGEPEQEVALVVMPTTLGTGAEMSRVACLDGSEGKRLIEGALLRADAAVLDSRATATLPGRLVMEGVFEAWSRILGALAGAPSGGARRGRHGSRARHPRRSSVSARATRSPPRSCPRPSCATRSRG